MKQMSCVKCYRRWFSHFKNHSWYVYLPAKYDIYDQKVAQNDECRGQQIIPHIKRKNPT